MKTVLDYVISKMQEPRLTEADWARWIAYQDMANFILKEMDK